MFKKLFSTGKAEDAPSSHGPVSAGRARELINEEPDLMLLDVRTPGEFQSGRIETAINIDIHASDFMQRIQGLDRSRPYLLYCRSGFRSGRALKRMKKMAFKAAYHMSGGIISWKASGFPVIQ